MNIIILNQKNKKKLNKILSSDYCKDAQIDESILKFIKIAFILTNKSKKICGICGLYRSNFGTYELFIALHKKIRNRGYGKKLIKNLIKWSKANKISFFIQTYKNAKYIHALKLYMSLGFDSQINFDKKILLMKKSYPILITTYRRFFFYYDCLKYYIKIILHKFLKIKF
jgi:GNAT superfamily N-acetyltransferase